MLFYIENAIADGSVMLIATPAGCLPEPDFPNDSNLLSMGFDVCIVSRSRCCFR
ncbi:MAG: hypothetical protein ACRES5_17255 [Pseudomonas sp.]|uniref:hypothetical protein n=1 Tax=Stenotrophomonas sp. TaxID=69392 RepID=UPI003D6C774E